MVILHHRLCTGDSSFTDLHGRLQPVSPIPPFLGALTDALVRSHLYHRTHNSLPLPVVPPHKKRPKADRDSFVPSPAPTPAATPTVSTFHRTPLAPGILTAEGTLEITVRWIQGITEGTSASSSPSIPLTDELQLQLIAIQSSTQDPPCEKPTNSPSTDPITTPKWAKYESPTIHRTTTSDPSISATERVEREEA